MPQRARLLTTSGLAVTVAAFLILMPSAARAQQPPPTRAQLEAATYAADVAPGGSATLVGGRFEAPAAPGSASKVTVSLQAAANGPIGGQPGAAVILASSGGGSGTFFDLYAVDASAKTIARAALGDRIVLNALTFGPNGRIVVAMVAHAPADPACCPTSVQTREYEIRDGALMLLTTATPGPPPPRPATTGTGGGTATRALGGHVPWAALATVLALSLGLRAATRRPVRPR